jgi:hypothetical protein
MWVPPWLRQRVTRRALRLSASALLILFRLFSLKRRTALVLFHLGTDAALYGWLAAIGARRRLRVRPPWRSSGAGCAGRPPQCTGSPWPSSWAPRTPWGRGSPGGCGGGGGAAPPPCVPLLLTRTAPDRLCGIAADSAEKRKGTERKEKVLVLTAHEVISSVWLAECMTSIVAIHSIRGWK